MLEYIEHDNDVTHIWHNSTIVESIITDRGTKVEIVDRTHWGLTCYMNNCIQSCLFDEKIYHDALVSKVMHDGVKNVLILGGGEGSTAREVLKWPVERVDMIEWDKDVVDLFKKYPKWCQSWDDQRLHIQYEDVFQWTPSMKYDAIIIDLFEPNEQFVDLVRNALNWTTSPNGNLVMYAGMKNIKDPPYKKIMHELSNEVSNEVWRGIPLYTHPIKMYSMYIPSFLGEVTFLGF